jgi:protein-S-isoprenylcysteine O-methyltransferase Ste14
MDDRLSSYILLAVIWSAYCILHSLLISVPFTRWVDRRLPNGRRYQRLAFNLFALLSLVPIVVFTYELQSAAVFRWDGHLRWLQAALLLAAIVLVVAGGSKYDFRQFLGLAQLKATDTCLGIGADCALNTSGILGVVRHPWYTAVILLLWARDMDPAALVVNTVLTAYLVVGTILEERKLVAEFGQNYREYQQAVSMFLPFKWLKSKF